MPSFLTWLGGAAALISVAGCGQAIIGSFLLSRFRWQEKRPPCPDASNLPAVTILKPLHGDEPLLSEALESVCRQDYPHLQIVFGVQSTEDTAISHVRALQARYPTRDITLVIDPQQHGINRKVGNLINMYAFARHDVLVISDSDIHAGPHYLRDIVRTLESPQVGLVTTLYAGLPASKTLVREMGAIQINHNFLPGVMMSRLLGRRDCLGATMALRREILEQIGGLEALVDHVADDAVLGHAVRALDLDIALAPCLTWTTIGESSMRELLLHELRWGRTVKNLEPVGYGMSAIQLPLFWATLTLLCCHDARWAWVFFGTVWLIRAMTAIGVNIATAVPAWAMLPLLPLREWISAAIMVGSARGKEVAWRGQTLHIERHVPVTNLRQPLEPGD
ncbi:bacteriohopanetetrol glucosamine biosynthesis glycosyltransferase HpnI [Brytella acorum]|uniref:Bacteriohopanetetrol glucosamine biosynthesis glycosyltransferase HpnI n=1 Tax=Brytella acorum TaxID=2959299 RepID=A0AA35UFM5_9PROT|nr:bacteriohopanetetrol glucosamine biosynthesis glycosyltransferase HpnI [Brytella acorum]MDF3625422.1 bacteriohopanetetrol glucosamine biosynthesis glycosyltransferase HpnI [Brytella acorum]CAI9120273.1 bacteriohopanetetrol glucosamine biosynthesis glycosyltransferase HpnI [Brytella acorum]